jgi:hypothetical protein
MDPSRIFQLIQIIKRLGNNDMANFKFASNFGLTPKTKEIINEILVKDQANIQELLDEIPESEIFILLKYLELCKEKEAKKLEQQSKCSFSLIKEIIDLSKISQNLLAEQFAKYPEIAQIFAQNLSAEDYKSLKTATFIERKDSYDVRSDLSKDIPEDIKKGTIEESKVEINFDAKNKFEFPDLEKTNNHQSPEKAPISKKIGGEFITMPAKQKSKKIAGGEIPGAWGKTHNPYGYKSVESADSVNIKKKMEEDFPTLATQIDNKGIYFPKFTKFF